MNPEHASTADLLAEQVRTQSAKIGVVGVGYVGLPLLKAFIEAGFQCVGFDTDNQKIQSLLRGESYIKHIEDSLVLQWLSSGLFEASCQMSRLAEVDAILICVPTPLSETRDPDLAYVTGTAKAIAQVLRPGQLIVLESTTYPTTTRDVVLPILQANPSGLKAGVDFFVAYSPEREDPGNADFTAASIPKVVGGCDEVSTRLACQLYEHAIVKVIPVSSAEVAEACKILENTYRSVNIALVNELKLLFDRMGIDVWEVIDAAKTKPFGFQAFYPGPGLGGHCIPIDPFYLSWLARREGMTTRFIELAGEVNTRMPEYVVTRLGEALNQMSKPIKGSRILILGMAYKRNVDDSRESPSFELMDMLIDRGAHVSYNDPHIPKLPAKRRYEDLPTLDSTPLTAQYLRAMDCVLIATDHSDYDYDFVVQHSSLVVDTRNATVDVRQGRQKIVKA